MNSNESREDKKGIFAYKDFVWASEKRRPGDESCILSRALRSHDLAIAST